VTRFARGLRVFFFLGFSVLSSSLLSIFLLRLFLGTDVEVGEVFFSEGEDVEAGECFFFKFKSFVVTRVQPRHPFPKKVGEEK
jgi:hypothetical protein